MNFRLPKIHAAIQLAAILTTLALPITLPAAPAAPTETPLILKPDTTLADLFGYEPEYTVNVPSFDSQNRPYIRSRGIDLDETAFIHTLENGRWIERPFLPAIRRAYPTFKRTFRAGGWWDPRIVFDDNDRLYTKVVIELEDGTHRNLLLHSADFGKSFEITEIPAGASIAEHRSGHNDTSRPPFLMIAEHLKNHRSTYASYNRLSVTQPKWENGKLVIPDPVPVGENTVGETETHSGDTTLAVTRDGKTHFVWAGVTDRSEPAGTPFHIATYNHATGEVSRPLLLAMNPPANNAHNVPGIVMDSDGYLHVVTGTHGLSFYYLRSLQPNDPTKGWTEPLPVLARSPDGTRAGQTYAGLVCDQNDTLHLVFRHWQIGPERYPHMDPKAGKHFGALSYMRRPKNQPWSDPKTLLVPARAEYSIYYHRLSLDRKNRLYIAPTYYDRILLNRSTQNRFHNRMLLVSPNQGQTFHLAETKDFQ